MADLIYRTEDLTLEEVMDFFVETSKDREVVNTLKSISPTILIGSRGVGKSFLLRVAEAELRENFDSEKVFPVYLTFNKTSLIHTHNPDQFQCWMLAKICSRIIRSLTQAGLLCKYLPSISVIAGGAFDIRKESRIEEIANAFEQSWRSPGEMLDVEGMPTIEDFKDAIEDLCGQLEIKRFTLFIDEAAHVFIPEQQRQFFTLYRDLRSSFITCNAAIYPGVTSFGDVFQPAHDATMIALERDILSKEYIDNMRDIVQKQADSTLTANIERNGQNFATLAYAATGNPRILIKIVSRAPKINNSQVNEVVREYFRTDIWGEHSTLSGKYAGHESLIDWGRRFIEEEVLPELQRKNNEYLLSEKSTCFFWIHRNAPQVVQEAIRLLAYTGIVTEHATGIKATRSEIGSRYAVNLGCLFSLETAVTTRGFQIARNLDPRRMSEYGMNHPAYNVLLETDPVINGTNMETLVQERLTDSIEALDITEWLKSRLNELELFNIGDVINAPEEKLQEARFVGQKRARQIHNAALAAVYEYLSG